MTVATVYEGAVLTSATHVAVDPTQFALASAFPVNPEVSSETRPQVSSETRATSVQLWLGAGGLNRSLRVAVIIDVDGTFIVEDPESGIFGQGPRLSSALQDFRSALAEHLQALRAADKLSAHMQDQARYLTELLG